MIIRNRPSLHICWVLVRWGLETTVYVKFLQVGTVKWITTVFFFSQATMYCYLDFKLSDFKNPKLLLLKDTPNKDLCSQQVFMLSSIARLVDTNNSCGATSILPTEWNSDRNFVCTDIKIESLYLPLWTLFTLWLSWVNLRTQEHDRVRHRSLHSSLALIVSFT